MTLTDKERESLDDYFVRRGLGRLWENLKLLIDASGGGGGNTEEIKKTVNELKSSVKDLSEVVSNIDVKPSTNQEIDNLFN
jgi:archaellum component FlaC